jgi:hypothetical protein
MCQGRPGGTIGAGIGDNREFAAVGEVELGIVGNQCVAGGGRIGGCSGTRVGLRLGGDQHLAAVAERNRGFQCEDILKNALHDHAGAGRAGSSSGVGNADHIERSAIVERDRYRPNGRDRYVSNLAAV